MDDLPFEAGQANLIGGPKPADDVAAQTAGMSSFFRYSVQLDRITND
jgi:hypothetical protein